MSSSNETLQPGIARYMEDASFGYRDFASREREDISTFRVQDYSWEEHGFSFINRLYPDIGQILDDKFSSTVNLTYFTYVVGRNFNSLFCELTVKHNLTVLVVDLLKFPSMLVTIILYIERMSYWCQ